MTVLERLTAIETHLEMLVDGFHNHLIHHWAVELILVSAIVGVVVKYVFFSKVDKVRRVKR